MAIATATATPPAFLLFDFLLASSWTWFALLCATIAAALRIVFPRHRLQLTLAAESASVPAISSLLDASNVVLQPSCASSSSSASLQQSFKRRAQSKSTSALEKLLHGDFWSPAVEALSPVLDAKLPSKLKRIASASKVFHGQHGYAKMRTSRRTQQAACNALGKTSHASAGKNGMQSLEKVVDSVKASASGLGLKFQWKTQTEEEKDASRRPSMEGREICAEDSAMSLPSWASYLSAPSHLKWSPSREYFPPSHLESPLLSFEKQFGWDKVLNNKLGSLWRFPSSTVSERSLKSNNVVRMWDDLPRNLIRKLDLNEASTLALGTCFQDARVCTGDLDGKVSMWELERRGCTRASAKFAQPVFALSMNYEQSATVVGSDSSIGLWDHRSSSCNTNFTSLLSGPCSDLKSKGNEICVATDSGVLSMYDLRNLGIGPSVSVIAPKKQLSHPTSDFEHTFWEKFAGVNEEDNEVECDSGMEVHHVGSNKCSSLMSRLTTFVREVTHML